MIRTYVFCVSFVGILVSSAFAQEVTLDIIAQADPSSEAVVVELFPARPESSVFQITLTSQRAAKQSFETSQQSVVLQELVQGEAYTIQAYALDRFGQVIEVSPEETFVAP